MRLTGIEELAYHLAAKAPQPTTLGSRNHQRIQVALNGTGGVAFVLAAHTAEVAEHRLLPGGGTHQPAVALAAQGNRRHGAAHGLQRTAPGGDNRIALAVSVAQRLVLQPAGVAHAIVAAQRFHLLGKGV